MTPSTGDGPSDLRVSTKTPPLTFALLGASNLSRGYRAFSGCLRDSLRPRSTRFIAALGPGRGYVAPGGFFHLRYPPILESPLFRDTDRQAAQKGQVVAFLTDIGNDFLFGITGNELCQALEKIIQRFEAANACIFVTPIHPVLEKFLTPQRYLLLRTWLYPNSQVPYSQVIEGLCQVNQFLEEAEQRQRLSLVRGMDAYLGWDAVHYGLVSAGGAWAHAATQILKGMGGTGGRLIPFHRMAASYADSAKRLLGSELFKLQPRPTGFY